MEQQQILELKKLNAAYIASLEYDYCPEGKKATEVNDLFITGYISISLLKKALNENQGRRPDEISGSIYELIKSLP